MDATWIAVLTISVGVAASFVPFVPAGAISSLGVWYYWVSTGFSSPGPVVLATLTLLGTSASLSEGLPTGLAALGVGASTLTGPIGGVVSAVATGAGYVASTIVEFALTLTMLGVFVLWGAPGFVTW